MTAISPTLGPDAGGTKVTITGVLVEELFEELTKTNDIDGTEVGGSPGSSTVRVNDNALSEAGRAYFAQIYVKDPKGW